MANEYANTGLTEPGTSSVNFSGGASWATAFGSILQVMGALQMGNASKAEGERAKASAEFSAWQAEQHANLAKAAAQRQALEEQRIGRLLASRIVAVAAASGGGVSDTTIVNLLANQSAVAGYKSGVALYEGESKARQLEMTAGAQRLAGAQAVQVGLDRDVGYKLVAGGYAAKAGATLYSRYGYDNPIRDRNSQLDIS